MISSMMIYPLLTRLLVLFPLISLIFSFFWALCALFLLVASAGLLVWYDLSL